MCVWCGLVDLSGPFCSIGDVDTLNIFVPKANVAVPVLQRGAQPRLLAGGWFVMMAMP